MLGQVDHHFLPHRPAIRVLQEVHLVEDDEAEVVQEPRPSVDHVAQHLGGHHHDRRVAVDRVVAGQEADLVVAVHGDEVTELLVRERLDRCRVERPQAGASGRVDAVLRDDRLAAPGRNCDDDVVAAIERVEGLVLEPIDRERVPGDEVGPVGTVDRSSLTPRPDVDARPAIR